mmetsp:Transcript_3897/g.15499  ORF Transcript_3897/g.15499 Transcript_3897/m.15499 type:complete len:102 (+) Transcript_3897:440-745(+)
MTIGSHVRIARDAVVEAAWLGVGVRVGARAVVGKAAIVKDYCVIAADAVVPDEAVLAPCSIVAGSPARVVGSVSPGAIAAWPREAELLVRRAMSATGPKAA